VLRVTEERSSDLLHGLSGTPVLLADDEDDALHESKCMVEHEGFHLAVDPACLYPSQKRHRADGR